MMPKNFFSILLLFGLFISFAVEAIDSKSVWLEVVEPALKEQVKIELLMNYGDSARGQPDYPMVGLGDGLGIYQQQDEVFIVMNHELFSHQGAVRSHGEHGAFVSKWRMGKEGIIQGEDLIQRIAVYDHKLNQYKLTIMSLNRLCSADFPLQSALLFQDQNKKYGTQDRIFFSGEEISTNYLKRHGRAFAHVVDGELAGTSFELPTFGKMAFENVVLNPFPQLQTIAVLLDDATNKTYDIPEDKKAIEAIHQNPPSELYIYVGRKQQGVNHPIDAAGLNNGQLYGVQVDGMRKENRNRTIEPQTRFKLIPLDNVRQDRDGKSLQLQSIDKGITQFLRIEDGAWNLKDQRYSEFFFATTDRFGGNSRLYRLQFDDITKPLQGGALTVVLNGNEHGIEMMDNITVDPWGRVLIQEDPGKNDRVARIWLYDLNTEKLYRIAQFKNQYFSPNINNKDFFTSDEESSGIVHAFDTLGEGWYILNAQVHRKHPNPEIVEYGQLLKMYVPKQLPWL